MRHVHDVVIAGAGPTALSLAADAIGRGVEKVLVLAPGETVTPMTAMGRYGVPVRFRQPVERIEVLDDGRVVLESETDSFVAKVAVIVGTSAGAPVPFPVAEGVQVRVHTSCDGFDPQDQDVLALGSGDRLVEQTVRLVEAGARVVVAFDGSFADLSHLAQDTLVELEHDRRATVLWHSLPDDVEDVDGYPLVYFPDRRTPDIQVDHLVYVGSTGSEEHPSTASPGHVPGVRDPVFHVDDMALKASPMGPASIWDTIVSTMGDQLPLRRPPAVRAVAVREEAALRRQHYNATITYFDHSHEDLWVLRVKPDRHEVSHIAGQYTTLGLGYWEPRSDDRSDVASESKRASLIRRSYSISSRVLDPHGYLVDPSREEEIEFYIVHVRPDGDRVPALTPRLALKRAGDRIYLGPRIAGRYTLQPVSDPASDVVFLATGTGEAPHNAMVAELLRKGHYGGIVSAVTVRHQRDLGYEETHAELRTRYPNYQYVTLPTREPSIEKRYIQDLITSGELEERLPQSLDPSRTHVFLCGNPKMIGLPTWEGDTPSFPEEVGVTQLLHERGFDLDRRRHFGNVHFEEYW